MPRPGMILLLVTLSAVLVMTEGSVYDKTADDLTEEPKQAGHVGKTPSKANILPRN